MERLPCAFNPRPNEHRAKHYTVNEKEKTQGLFFVYPETVNRASP